MKSLNKLFLAVSLAFFVLLGSVFAGNITASSLSVENVAGNDVALLTLSNGIATDSEFAKIVAIVEEFGTSLDLTEDASFKIALGQDRTFQFKLDDLTETPQLFKEGNTYTLTFNVTDIQSGSITSVSDIFLFGAKDDSGEGLNLIIESVKLNDEAIADDDVLQLMNGETLDVELRFEAQKNFDDARLSVSLEGYEHKEIRASTEVFSVKEGKTYTKTLTLALPSDMRSDRDYTLRIFGANDLAGLTYKQYQVFVDTQRHRVDVMDVIMTPNSAVEPGQNIIANVRMKNRGQKAQDSVKVSVSVPALGISEYSYISNLGLNAVATSDDMLLSVPSTAKPGQYEVVVALAYNDGYTESNKAYTMNVVAPQTIAEKNLLVSVPKVADLVAGQATSFDIVVANPNKGSKPISLAVADNAWADVEVAPTLKMIEGGADGVFTVTVTPKSAISGEKELSFMVKEAGVSVSDVNVKVYVGANDSVNWLNVVLAVLLVIAVIVLIALVIAVARKKDENKEEESSSEEYY